MDKTEAERNINLQKDIDQAFNRLTTLITKKKLKQVNVEEPKESAAGLRCEDDQSMQADGEAEVGQHDFKESADEKIYAPLTTVDKNIEDVDGLLCEDDQSMQANGEAEVGQYDFKESADEKIYASLTTVGENNNNLSSYTQAVVGGFDILNDDKNIEDVDLAGVNIDGILEQILGSRSLYQDSTFVSDQHPSSEQVIKDGQFSVKSIKSITAKRSSEVAGGVAQYSGDGQVKETRTVTAETRPVPVKSLPITPTIGRVKQDLTGDRGFKLMHNQPQSIHQHVQIPR